MNETNRTFLFNAARPAPPVAGLACSLLALASDAGATGGLDPTFGSDGRVAITEIATSIAEYAATEQTDGKVVVVSTIAEASDAYFPRLVLARLEEDGTLDGTFGSSGILIGSQVNEEGEAVIQQADGKLVVAGSSWSSSYGDDAALWRFDLNGTADTTFGTGGAVSLDLGAFERASGLLQQPDGKLIIAGIRETSPDNGRGNWMLARFNEDGSLDTGFGSGGTVILDALENAPSGDVTSLIRQPDGKLLLAGSGSTGDGGVATVVRVGADGAPDETFGVGGVLEIAAEEIQPDRTYVQSVSAAVQDDGRIVLAGVVGRADCCDDYGDYIVHTDAFLLRLESDGAADSGFAIPSQELARIQFSSVTIQSGGEIVVAFSGVGLYEMGLMRFDSDGLIDGSFGVGGVSIVGVESSAGTPIYHSGVLIQRADGKLVLVGAYAIENTDIGWYPVIARFIADASGLPPQGGTHDNGGGNGGTQGGGDGTGGTQNSGGGSSDLALLGLFLLGLGQFARATRRGFKATRAPQTETRPPDM